MLYIAKIPGYGVRCIAALAMIIFTSLSSNFADAQSPTNANWESFAWSRLAYKSPGEVIDTLSKNITPKDVQQKSSRVHENEEGDLVSVTWRGKFPSNPKSSYSIKMFQVFGDNGWASNGDASIVVTNSGKRASLDIRLESMSADAPPDAPRKYVAQLHKEPNSIGENDITIPLTDDQQAWFASLIKHLETKVKK